MTKKPQAVAAGRSPWLAFYVLCLGTLMVIVDATVVNVALPSIKDDLHFSSVSLVWVMNAYVLTFSGFVLLGGRLGDLFGQRKIFLLGIALFTFASAACGWANTQALLIGARAIQGLGGAIVASVSLSLTVNLFPESATRARAMGVYSFVGLFGGAFGLLLGGTLTGELNWHWIFLINLPLGAAIFVLAVVSLTESPDARPGGQLDVPGAVAVTLASVIAIYAIVNANEVGWTSAQTIGLLAGSVALLIILLHIEARVAAPLIPLDLFRRRNLPVACLICVLWPFATWGWFLITALYLQVVLKCTPEQVGLAFLPANLAAAAVSLSLSAKLVARFGVKRALSMGLLLTAGGFAFFARAPVDGSVALDVVPGMLLEGVGSGLACSPMLLAVTSDIPAAESGLVSGLVNAAGMIAGALGLAILATAASAYTANLTASGVTLPIALDGGYHVAFLIGAVVLGVASVLAAAFLTVEQQEAVSAGEIRRQDSSASV